MACYFLALPFKIQTLKVNEITSLVRMIFAMLSQENYPFSKLNFRK